jgi:hypothetical protein
MTDNRYRLAWLSARRRASFAAKAFYAEASAARELESAMTEMKPASVDDSGVSIYYCETSGEVEQYPGGGFDVCCERGPEGHVPLTQAAIDAIKAEVKDDVIAIINAEVDHSRCAKRACQGIEQLFGRADS